MKKDKNKQKDGYLEMSAFDEHNSKVLDVVQKELAELNIDALWAKIEQIEPILTDNIEPILNNLYKICTTNSKRIDALWEAVDVLRQQTNKDE
tara:strand:+ start:58 stop:336 length:279 start_codon:yes stop_codon:yes gene_type:complete